MNQKQAKKFTKQVQKDMKVKIKAPGDLLTQAQATSRKPTKRTVAILGLI